MVWCMRELLCSEQLTGEGQGDLRRGRMKSGECKENSKETISDNRLKKWRRVCEPIGICFEKCVWEILRKKKEIDFYVVLKDLEEAGERIDPRCPYGRCGGYLRAKEKLVNAVRSFCLESKACVSVGREESAWFLVDFFLDISILFYVI